MFDCDPPTFYEAKQVRGRKKYECCECLSVIAKGEPHERAAGLWEGSFDTFRTCKLCTDMRDEIGLQCYAHGLMMDVVDERDFEAGSPAVEFLKRRQENWERNYAKRKVGV